MDSSTKFFQELEARGHEPLLEKVRGTVRVDLTNGKRTARWLVAIDKGGIAVSHANARADCVIRAKKTLFDGITRGETSAVAAVLRGDIAIEGDRELLVLFQRLFPGPRRERT